MYMPYLSKMVKEVKNYEGLYEVNDDGLIITHNWRNAGKTAILKPAIDKKGYLRVGLMKEGKLSSHRVHRLVAIAFINNSENKPQVNHRNGIKTDNSVDNLEWSTCKENMKHAYDNNLSFKVDPNNKIAKAGTLNGNALLNDQNVIEIRSKFNKRVYTRRMLAKEYNVTENCVKDVILGYSWKHLL